MVKNVVYFFFIFMFFTSTVEAQKGIHGFLPKDTVLNINYVFYLHGRIVEEAEDVQEIISPQFGKYDYIAILDSLGNHGRNLVISEKRPALTEPLAYARKVSAQIDTLLKRGVSPSKITVIGASKGGFIAMYVSSFTKNKNIKYVFMACCGDDIDRDPLLDIYGQILSIYEKSDMYATSCRPVFKKCKKNIIFKEYEINTGKQHGFFFQPISEWLEPTLNWINF